MSDCARSPVTPSRVGPHETPAEARLVAQLTRLIQCPSITPQEGGALDYLEAELEQLGFTCHRLPFHEAGIHSVDNLFAILRAADPDAPHLCFAGHTDVVPPGSLDAWRHAPFASICEDRLIYGRGAVDMKGGIVAFLGAVQDFLSTAAQAENCTIPTISFLITGDEEGIAINGTRKVLTWMQQQEAIPDFCLVGEPTSHDQVGDCIKIGRRGSLNCALVLHGQQGHVAFPEHTRNPLRHLQAVMALLAPGPDECASELFDPTYVSFTSVDTGNDATNVVPGQVTLKFNIRFNDQHTFDSLVAWIHAAVTSVTEDYEVAFEFSGEADICRAPNWCDHLERAIVTTTGVRPQRSTRGATSDARFIKDFAPVVELGLRFQTMHQVDEHVSIDDLVTLKNIYYQFLLGIASRKMASHE